MELERERPDVEIEREIDVVSERRTDVELESGNDVELEREGLRLS